MIRVHLSDSFVVRMAAIFAARRIAYGNPEPGDFELAQLDPADWTDYHDPDAECDVYQSTDDEAMQLIEELFASIGDDAVRTILTVPR